MFALWLLVLLSLFCLGLGVRTYFRTKKTKFILQRHRAFYLAVSGIKQAVAVIENDENTETDHLQEQWAQTIKEQIAFSSPKKEASFTIRIKDESSRIRIEEENRPLVKKIFEKKELNEIDNKLTYIFNYIDEDTDPEGGDSESENEDKVKNGKLRCVEELLLVQGILIEDYTAIKDVVTVFGDDNKVNINTAEREVVEVLLDVLIGEGKINNDVEAQVLQVRFDEGGYYEDESQLDGLDEDLKDYFKTNSDYFRIQSSVEVEDVRKKITCVIDRSGKILYWNEK